MRGEQNITDFSSNFLWLCALLGKSVRMPHEAFLTSNIAQNCSKLPRWTINFRSMQMKIPIQPLEMAVKCSMMIMVLGDDFNGNHINVGD